MHRLDAPTIATSSGVGVRLVQRLLGPAGWTSGFLALHWRGPLGTKIAPRRPRLAPDGSSADQPVGERFMPEFGSWGTAWWKPLVFILIAGHLTNVCVTLFLHRAQTHRSVKFHTFAALPMRLWLWLTTAIVTKEWVACHRKHHAFADREGDPHSPVMEGLRNIVLKGAFY